MVYAPVFLFLFLTLTLISASQSDSFEKRIDKLKVELENKNLMALQRAKDNRPISSRKMFHLAKIKATKNSSENRIDNLKEELENQNQMVLQRARDNRRSSSGERYHLKKATKKVTRATRTMRRQFF